MCQFIKNALFKDRLFKFIFGKENEQSKRWRLQLYNALNGDFQWTATIINLHPDHNATLNKSCIPLYHYVKFVSMITANKKAGFENKDSIVKAVDQAIKEELLEGFFKIHRAEVIGMCLEEVSEEEQRRIWHKDGYTVGLAKGEQKGRSEKAIEAAEKALILNISPEQVSQISGLPLKKVLELKKNMPVEA